MRRLQSCGELRDSREWNGLRGLVHDDDLHECGRQRTATAPENFASKQVAYWQNRGSS